MLTRGNKTRLMLNVEQRHGNQLERLIPDLYRQHNGRWSKVADELGISYGTLMAWCFRFGVVERRDVVRIA